MKTARPELVITEMGNRAVGKDHQRVADRGPVRIEETVEIVPKAHRRRAKDGLSLRDRPKERPTVWAKRRTRSVHPLEGFHHRDRKDRWRRMVGLPTWDPLSMPS